MKTICLFIAMIFGSTRVYVVAAAINSNTLSLHAAELYAQATYTWIGGSGSWINAANWSPARTVPATNDILIFSDGTTETVTNVPNQIIGQLHVRSGTQVTWQAAVNSTILRIWESTIGTDFTVVANSALNLDGPNSIAISLTGAAVGNIYGSITFTGGAHKLTADFSLYFNAGSYFKVGEGCSGSPLNGPLGAVTFISGSVMEQVAGGDPFGQESTRFLPGSLYKVTGSAFTPYFSGRTYSNVEIDNPAYAVSSTGTNLLTMDNLTITSGTQNFNLTGGINIKGHITVGAGAALGFSPATAGTLNLNGTAAQSINNSGTLIFGANATVNINNAAGITLNAPVTMLGTLAFTKGKINTSAVNLLTMGAGSAVTGASNTSFVYGPVKKIGNTNFIFPVGKSNGLVPIGISNFTGGAVTDEFTAEYFRLSGAALGTVTTPSITKVSSCEYWKLDLNNGTPTVDLTLYWNSNNPCNGSFYISSLADLEIAHFNGANWNSSSNEVSIKNGIPAAGNITWTGVNTFSPFTLASITGINPLPITINYFNGTKQNGNHLLNWKVTCISTPGATLEMQRSTDGNNYNTIYSIVATALRCQQPFDYTDNLPAKGTNYYRLKMIDVDGKITYSSIVPLINAVKGIEIMNIAPNPIVIAAFNLKVSTAEKTQMELVITDMQGRILQTQAVNTIAGFNVIPVNVKSLAAGTYQLVCNTAEGRAGVLRFVIQ